jgi:hypothetical protein
MEQRIENFLRLTLKRVLAVSLLPSLASDETEIENIEDRPLGIVSDAGRQCACRSADPAADFDYGAIGYEGNIVEQLSLDGGQPSVRK